MSPFEPSFAALESWLLDPPVDGVLLTYVAPDSRFAAAGLARGDVITSVDGHAVAHWLEFGKRMIPGEDDLETRMLQVQSLEGKRRIAKIAAGPTAHFGVPLASGVGVNAHEPGWEELEEADDTPVLSGVADGTQIYLRAHLGGGPAGFEAVRLRRGDGHLFVDLLLRLSQETTDGGWDFRARLSSTHKLAHGLPVVRTRYHEGMPGVERLRGDLSLENGTWSGKRAGAGKELEIVAIPQTEPWSSIGYTAYLQALTMPQRVGAALTWPVLAEGTGVVTRRQRLVCLGRGEVVVDGRDVPVWSYELRHYGAYGECERFHVTSDRHLARIDWGANYGGCWAEAVPRERLLDGVPARVTFS